MAIRHVPTSLILLMLLVCGGASGQDAAPVAGSDLNRARVLLQFGREDIVREDLRLSEKEGAAFWPVYDRYQSEMRPIRDRYAELVLNYLQAYRAGTVTEKMAEQMTSDNLEIQREVLKVKDKFLKDFRKALPARKAARFYQLENKMEVELESQLSLIVPLIDPV